MRMSSNEKDKSYARIVASASRLLRERGIEGASVGDVMGDAGMTVGGFYKQFESKEGLVAKAINDAFAEFIRPLEEGGGPAYEAFKALYLSRDHLTNPGRGCPVANLGQEVARGSEGLRSTFGMGVRRIVDRLAAHRKGSLASRRAAAMGEFSMLVGAVVIARASDHDMANKVMSACKRSTS